MKKRTVLMIVLTAVLMLVGCKEDVILENTRIYSVGSDIRSLEIRINAAEFTVETADTFSVESNLKYLAVFEEDGTLCIRENVKSASAYTNAMLTLCIPAGTVFEDVHIVTGAAKMSAGELTAQSLELQLGAGDVRIKTLNAISEAEIRGGAGKITVGEGALRDLDLEMGAGELDLTAELLGSNDLTLGIGASRLVLLGGKDAYCVQIEKGLGTVTVDGLPVSEYDSGAGGNRVEIKGGIGIFDLKFHGAEEVNSFE